MALIRVCDICNKTLEEGKYVNIELHDYLMYRSVSLCTECFSKYINKDLVSIVANKELNLPSAMKKYATQIDNKKPVTLKDVKKKGNK